jgi:hypothetical protein
LSLLGRSNPRMRRHRDLPGPRSKAPRIEGQASIRQSLVNENGGIKD